MLKATDASDVTQQARRPSAHRAAESIVLAGGGAFRVARITLQSSAAASVAALASAASESHCRSTETIRLKLVHASAFAATWTMNISHESVRSKRASSCLSDKPRSIS